MTATYVHGSGESGDGLCLACCEEGLEAYGLKPHDADPDPDSDRDEPWCAVCGHSVDEIEEGDVATWRAEQAEGRESTDARR